MYCPIKVFYVNRNCLWTKVIRDSLEKARVTTIVLLYKGNNKWSLPNIDQEQSYNICLE